MLHQLKTLQKEQAKAAIIEPANIQSEKFKTPTFIYHEVVIEQIIHYENKNAIPSFQLQIFCSYIEQEVKKRTKTNNKQQEVTLDYLGGVDGMKNIIKNFYNNQIEKIDKNEQDVARGIIKSLISEDKNRRILLEKDILRQKKSKPKLLQQMVDLRLLKVETRTRNAIYYEISHDSLVVPMYEVEETIELEAEYIIPKIIPSQPEKDPFLQTSSLQMRSTELLLKRNLPYWKQCRKGRLQLPGTIILYQLLSLF